jgi:predicted glycoside hydrolase/deacetylase ChbG (UPF0249 family)
MSTTLIVNADDFGLCKEISTGIIKAYSQGIVTSTSVVVNGRYFKEAIGLLKDTGIDAGIHLTFTGGEKPVSGDVGGLVDNNGFFLKSYKEVIPRILFKKFNRNALRKELSEQIRMLRDYNIPVSHIDSHQHLHMLPGVRDIVTELAKLFNIRWIRVPHSGMSGIKSILMDMLGKSLRSKLKEHNLSFTDSFKGFEYGGHMDEANLFSLLKGLDSGMTELMVHPGYNASQQYDWGYAWEDELKALTSINIKALIKDMNITLTSFKENK